jgi:hypothetical protein
MDNQNLQEGAQPKIINPVPVNNQQVSNSNIEQPVSNIDPASMQPEKKPKGCLRIFIIIVISFILLLILLFLTARFWYPSVFKGIFPESTNSAIYSEPVRKRISSVEDTELWTEITYQDLVFSVPFQEVVSLDNETATPYDFGDIYNFENDSKVVILESDEEYGNIKVVEENCLTSVTDLEDASNIGEMLNVSMLLMAKATQAKMIELQSIPYFFQNDEISVCQFGDVNTISTQGVDLIIESNSPDLYGVYKSFQIIITSNVITQSDIEKIVSSIEIK